MSKKQQAQNLKDFLDGGGDPRTIPPEQIFEGYKMIDDTLKQLLDYKYGIELPEALTAIYEIGLECIGADLPLSKDESNTDWFYGYGNNQAKAEARKAWAKACGVAEK